MTDVAGFLREAATLLRDRAGRVPPGPWVDDLMGTVADCDDDPVCSATFEPAVAAYIEVVHPGVALALADWLDSTAAWCVPNLERQRLAEREGMDTPPEHLPALYVAAAILDRGWKS